MRVISSRRFLVNSEHRTPLTELISYLFNHYPHLVSIDIPPDSFLWKGNEKELIQALKNFDKFNEQHDQRRS